MKQFYSLVLFIPQFIIILITIGVVLSSYHFLFRHFESGVLTGNIGILFVLAVSFQAGFSLLNNVLLGQGRLRMYALLIILCPAVTFTCILLNGGTISITSLLILISTNNLPSILILVYFAIKEHWIKTIDKDAIWQEFRLMLRFLVMGISIALFGKVTLFIIRDGLLGHFGQEQTNLWQSVIKLSDGYTGLYLAMMSSVFFPYVSSLLDKPAELGSFLRKYLSITSFLLLPAFFLIFLVRTEILTLFYQESYTQAQDLFSIQLLTDYLKFISWGIGFVMYAQARSLLFFVLEIFSYAIYLTASYFFAKKVGLIGVMYAELLQYIIYTATLFFIYRKLIFGKHA